MTLSEAEVRRVAHLARLSISDEELPEMTTQLSKVLGLVDQLGEVNTDGVEPLFTRSRLRTFCNPTEASPRWPVMKCCKMRLPPIASAFESLLFWGEACGPSGRI